MDFTKLLKHRQSVRKYANKPIERDKIDKLIEAVRLAPSACNSQPWKLIIVNEPNLKNEVANATFNTMIPMNKFVPEVPVIAVITMEKPKVITQIGGRIKNREFPMFDIGIAAEHLCLQATELGLGTCMLGWFDEKRIKKLLNIPAKKSIGLLITVGYAADNYPLREKKRKSVGEMSEFNKY